MFPWGNSWSASWPYYYEDLRMSVVRASGVAAELISLEDAKAFLRVSTDTDDDLITSLIRSARHYAETLTGRSLAKKDYILTLNRFPNLYYDRTNEIQLWPPPLSSCDRIEYTDSDGNVQTKQNSEFQVDPFSEPGKVAPLSGQCWPATKYGTLNAVKVFFSAGYDPPDTVPDVQNQITVNLSSQSVNASINLEILEDLITAMKQTVLHFYQNRDVVIAMPGAGGIYQPLPHHLEAIFAAHRLMNLAMTFPQ